MKNNPKDTTVKPQDNKEITLRTLHKLKADIYNRATRRAAEIVNRGELDGAAAKLQAISKRAQSEASRIAFAIQMVKLRA